MALERYHNILNGQTQPRFQTIDLSDKILQAKKHFDKCELCERLCQTSRSNGTPGECRVADKLNVTSAFVHYGEEEFFVPSFTVFFKSCNFHCQYCQNWDISQDENPVLECNMYVDQLAELIDNHKNCRNVNFVGGEPTPYLPFILEALSLVKIDIPVVWNSNFYMSDSAMQILNGVVDVYLSDFKYGNNECALRLSKIENYFDIVSVNHLKAFQDTDLVIRHLVLPEHIECCTRPILEFIKTNFDKNVIINIMKQYRPSFKADEYPEINREISYQDMGDALIIAEKLGLNYIT